MIKGIAIKTMFIRLSIIICPWKKKIIISANKSPTIVIPLKLGMNISSK